MGKILSLNLAQIVNVFLCLTFSGLISVNLEAQGVVITEDECCPAVLESLPPKFDMRSDVHCWIAKLEFALDGRPPWNIKFTLKFLMPAIPLVFLLLLNQLFFFLFGVKVLEASTLHLIFIKKAAIWICMAEKTTPADFRLSEVSGPQKFMWKLNDWHLSTHFLVCFLGRGKQQGQDTEGSRCREAELTPVCPFSNFWSNWCPFCSVFGHAVYLLVKQW